MGLTLFYNNKKLFFAEKRKSLKDRFSKRQQPNTKTTTQKKHEKAKAFFIMSFAYMLARPVVWPFLFIIIPASIGGTIALKNIQEKKRKAKTANTLETENPGFVPTPTKPNAEKKPTIGPKKTALLFITATTITIAETPLLPIIAHFIPIALTIRFVAKKLHEKRQKGKDTRQAKKKETKTKSHKKTSDQVSIFEMFTKKHRKSFGLTKAEHSSELANIPSEKLLDLNPYNKKNMGTILKNAESMMSKQDYNNLMQNLVNTMINNIETYGQNPHGNEYQNIVFYCIKNPDFIDIFKKTFTDLPEEKKNDIKETLEKRRFFPLLKHLPTDFMMKKNKGDNSQTERSIPYVTLTYPKR